LADTSFKEILEIDTELEIIRRDLEEMKNVDERLLR
jgi:hypothetical protein